MAAVHNFRAFAPPGFDIGRDAILLQRGNERADEAIPIEARCDLQLTRVLDKRANEPVVNAALDVNPRARIADLSRIEEDTGCYGLGPRLAVRGLQHEDRRPSGQ